MKTTKKGFTLIELIVVIAIIGVLAAILVPAMLGYVKKSKIQSANSAASTMLKNVNAALEEMDEDDTVTIPADGVYGHGSASGSGSNSFVDYVAYYSDDAKTANYAVYVKEGVAVAASARSGKYYGASPSKLTNKNYDTELSSYGKTLMGALNYACSKYNAAHTGANLPTNSSGFTTEF